MHGQQPRFQSRGIVQIKPPIADMFPGTRGLHVGPNLSVQMAVLKSRSLAQEVIQAVPQEALDELMNESLQPDYLLDFSNWIRRLRGKPPVTISPRERAMAELSSGRMTFRPLAKKSELIEISATAFKPRVAMDLVNGYTQVLVNWSRRSEQEDLVTTQKFLDFQLSQVRKDLEESEVALTKFEDQHGVVKLNERTQYEMARLLEAQGNLAQVQASQEITQRRLEALKKALEQSPDTPSVSSEVQVTADAARRISARLAQLEQVLIQMRARYTEEHPSLIAVREEIQNLRSQLAQLPVANTPGPRAGGASVSRDQVLATIATAKANLANLRTQEQSLRLQVDRLRKSLQKLTGRESEYSRLRNSVESNRTLANFLSEKLLALRIREQGQGGVVKIIDPPNFPSRPIQAASSRKLAFLLVFALGTAGGLGFLIEYIYEPVESEKAIQRHLELPFLGSALAAPSRQRKGDKHPLLLFNESYQAVMPQEFYRAIRTNLEAANLRTPFKAIMIASSCPGEGKSTTSINLAMALRELGRRVVLVDADLRQPGLSRVLQPEAQRGFVSLLQETKNDANATLPLDASLELMGVRPGSDFAFIPSGNPSRDPGALLASERTRKLVAWLKQRWDYVLFDSPPLLLVSDNLLFAASLDGVILVAQAGRTKKRDLQRAKDLLEKAGARILGVILNQVSPRQVPYYYHRYRSYYAPYAARQPHKH